MSSWRAVVPYLGNGDVPTGSGAPHPHEYVPVGVARAVEVRRIPSYTPLDSLG